MAISGESAKFMTNTSFACVVLSCPETNESSFALLHPARSCMGTTRCQEPCNVFGMLAGCHVLAGTTCRGQLTGQDEDGKSEEELQLQPIFVRGETSGGPVDPYANPEAPYKVDDSASPKLTEPLLNTPQDCSSHTQGTDQCHWSHLTYKDVMRL